MKLVFKAITSKPTTSQYNYLSSANDPILKMLAKTLFTFTICLTGLFLTSIPYLANGQECSSKLANNPVAIQAKHPLPIEDYGFSLHYDGEDSILVFSGNEADKRAIFRFNISSEEIEKIGQLPVKGEYAPLVPAGDSLLYFGNDQYAPRVLKFDTGSSTGRVVAELPYNFQSLVGSFTSGDPDKIYLLQQQQGNMVIHQFDTTTYCMTLAKNLTGASRSHAVSATLGDHHYVFTGEYFGSNGRAFTINRESLDNTTLGETNVEFYSSTPAAVVTANYLYVMGGYNRGKPFPTDGILRYEPGENSFSFIRIDEFPIGYENKYGHSPSMVYVGGLNRIYFFGGEGLIGNTYMPCNHIWYIDVGLME